MKLLTLFLFSFAGSIGLYAQTGPGGVGNSTTCPLWLDAHTMGGTNGADVNSWTDYSGNGNDATEATNTPNYSVGSLNGRNGINFDVDEMLYSPSNSSLDNGTYFNYFMAGNVEDVSILSYPFYMDYGTTSLYDRLFTGYISLSGTLSNYSRKNTGALLRPFYSTTSGLQVYEGEYKKSTNQVNGELDFIDDGTVSGTLRNATNHNGFGVGGYWNGSNVVYDANMIVGDIFVFTTEINSAQQNIVENYLSAKYGVAATTDMYTFQASHGLGVVGIGRDDVANSHTDSQGNGYVRINTPSALSDGDYMFIGHDDFELTSFNLNTNVPTALSGSSRFVRQWRVEKTNDLGTVTLVFDLDPATNFSADPNNYRLLIDTDADMSGTISQILTGTYNGGDQTITFTGVSLATGDFFTLAGDSPGDIHSITSGPWSTAGTWDCTCVPTSFNNVFIDPTHNVTVDVASNSFDLTVAATGTLTMSTEQTLSLFGDWIINGSLALTAGEIEMVGAQAQAINANGASVTLHDLEINNSGGFTVTMSPAQYTLDGVLSMTQGSLDVDNTSGGALIIESTSGTTGGRIGVISPSTSITGNVTARRFIPSGAADWRDISSPVIGATLADWDVGIPISCPDCPDGCAYDQNGCWHSVRYWTNSTEINVTTIGHTLVNGFGYPVFVGDDLVNWAGGALDATGTVNSGDVPVSVSSNWNTRGNPFICPVDYDNLTFAGVGQYYYVYDTQLGDWAWYDKVSGTGSGPDMNDGILAIGQGIWIKGPGTLTFPQSSKVTTGSTTFIKSQSPEDNSIYVVLDENSTTFSSTANIQQSYDGIDGLDEIDVYHLETPEQKGSSFSFIVENEYIRKTYLDYDFKDKILPVHVNIKNQGYYTISLENIANFSDYRHVYVVDKVSGETVDLMEEENYVFFSEEGTDDERFVMILSNNEVAESEVASYLEFGTENGVKITQLDHVIDIHIEDQTMENVEITLINALGQVEMFFEITDLIEGSNLINIPADVKGVRILSINNNGRLITKKLVF